MRSLVACPSHLTPADAFLSRRSTVPTTTRDTSNISALIVFGRKRGGGIRQILMA